MRWRPPADWRATGDAALAVALIGLLLVQVLTLDVSGAERAGVCAWGLVLLAPLAVRRRVPLTVMALVLAGGALGQLLPKRITDIEAIGLIVLLAIYTAAAHTGGRRAWAAGGMAAALGTSAMIGDPDGLNLAGVIFFAMLFGGPFVTGRVVRRRRLGEQRMQAERDAAQAAITDERARIARELHDVVAHAISVVVLQARGGRRLLDDDPEETRAALHTIEETARQALTEMRRLVGLLRDGEGAPALVPQPGMARLDALVAQIREAGLPVEVHMEGTPVALPPGVDLSAFRIVQEALTNALRHAGPARARVVVRYEADGVVVDVSDDGAGAVPAEPAGGGHGLVGIRERVTLFGGDLEAGPGPGGGFAVRARLPFSGPA